MKTGIVGKGARLMVVGSLGVLIGRGISAGIGKVVENRSWVTTKLQGRAPDCPWGEILAMQSKYGRWYRAYQEALDSLTVMQTDDGLDIESIASPRRKFWIKRSGTTKPGKELLAYLLTDHRVLAESGPAQVVRPGDVVLDCGAHVGVFVDTALRLGARRVIAVEPDPVLVTCLRRNFSQEIADGRVLVVPKGVWSSDGTMDLYLGSENSGMNTMIEATPSQRVAVPVVTIDGLLGELGIPCVSYIKMDIEGAEREALRGALATLRKCRPRLMLDSYHRSDDMRVLPAILRQAHSDYVMTCAGCEPGGNYVVPHVTFWR